MNLFKKTLQLLSLLPILASLVSVNLAQAAGSPAFNNLNGDQDFLTGRNVTRGQQAPTDPVNANANEEVEVVVYYHNTTEGSTANNTNIKVQLPPSTPAATQHVIRATLSASNAQPVTGTIVNGQEVGPANLTINSNSATNLGFVSGSVRWFPDASQHPGVPSNLPGGQNGDSIITGNGLNIGDIEGCFQHAGYVTFKVRLTAPQTPNQPPLEINKTVRKAGTTEAFVESNTVRPGEKVEYKVVVKNNSTTVTANNVKVRDILPAGFAFTGNVTVTPGTTLANPTALFGQNGVVVISQLAPQASVTLTFVAQTGTNYTNDQCLKNTVIASADNGSNSPEDTAQTCFTVPVKPTVELNKLVRKAGTTDTFQERNRINPGEKLEYLIVIKNIDGSQTIRNLKVQDFLPSQALYLGPTVLRKADGTTTTITGSITGPNGIVIPELKPGEKIEISFIAGTDSGLKNDTCIVNKVQVSSPDSNNNPTDTAETCFDVKTPPPVTPPVGNPPPTELPRTGPEASILLLTSMSGIGTGAARYWNSKKKLKKSLENMDIL